MNNLEDKAGNDKEDIRMEYVLSNDVAPVTDFFRLGKKMLSVWGLWPIDNLSPAWNTIYKIYGVFIILVTLVPYNVFSIIDTIEHIKEGNWMEIMPRLSVALAMLLGLVKVAVCAINTDTINKYMHIYDNPNCKYESTPFFHPNAIVRHCMWLYNAQTSVSVGLIGILIMTDIETYLKDPVVRSDNTTVIPLPFINWLPYDYSTSPYYEISFILTNFWFFVCAYVIFVYDTICMGQMIHTVGQLKIIKLALMTLRSRAVYHLEKNDFNGQQLDDYTVNRLVKWMFKKCVNHHQVVIKFTKKFQNLYSVIIFLQFFISCLMICFTILIATNNESPMSSRVTCLIILLCSMWELSVYCFFGNEIIRESEQLPAGMFHSHWYLLDQPNKKMLGIMMSRARRPIVVTVGRFVPLSLETFVTILKASYSYYAFLKNVST